MSKIAKIDSKGLLNVNAPIYDAIKKEKSWELLKNDQDVYIEIRKGNIIDAYYQGGRIVEFRYDKSEKRIKRATHPKYLGHYNCEENEYYTKRADGTYSPKYLECDLNESTIKDIKERIAKYYTKDDSSEENTSEKKRQGELIVSNRKEYIDSEFAYRMYEDGRNTIRFDLVKIQGDEIIVEELKMIRDSRLNSTTKPEVITQLGNYKKFIEENKDELLEYFKKLYKIKRSLSLLKEPMEDIELDKLKLRESPRLIIALDDDYRQIKEGNVPKGMNRKAERLKNIEMNLEGIDYILI